jgi:hypothetical protein
MKKKLITIIAIFAILGACIGVGIYVVAIWPLRSFEIVVDSKSYDITTSYGDKFTAHYINDSFLNSGWSVIITVNGEITELYVRADVQESGIIGILDSDYVRCYRIGTEIIFRRMSENEFFLLTEDFENATDLIPYISPLLDTSPDLEERYGPFIWEYNAAHEETAE